MHQHLLGYKVEEKIYLGVREQKRLNTAALRDLNQVCPFTKHWGQYAVLQEAIFDLFTFTSFFYKTDRLMTTNQLQWLCTNDTN
jgi:hypothetical protein